MLDGRQGGQFCFILLKSFKTISSLDTQSLHIQNFLTHSSTYPFFQQDKITPKGCLRSPPSLPSPPATWQGPKADSVDPRCCSRGLSAHCNTSASAKRRRLRRRAKRDFSVEPVLLKKKNMGGIQTGFCWRCFSMFWLGGLKKTWCFFGSLTHAFKEYDTMIR